MLVELSFCYLALISALPLVFAHIEHRQWWTLQLMLSCYLPWRLLTATTAVAVASVLYEAIYLRDPQDFVVETILAISAVYLASGILTFLYPLAESPDYVHVRWQSWSGPSRTGVPFQMAKYLGDEVDWQSLRASYPGHYHGHSVEAFIDLLPHVSDRIVEDPTALLTARLAMDEDADTVWVPRSDVKLGVYAPSSDPDHAVSLLWGPSLGFRPRCSRGIIAVPTSYLKFRPTLNNGLDARPICLAHGILARNKGLEPSTLVCNLSDSHSFRVFEENSVLWPRPAKTLRSIYREEFARSFSELGQAYVTAATELALLVADTRYSVLQDWLDAAMEHQDLRLNNRVADLGATAQDLDRLYRGHYAAMLASLSLHRIGIRIRPELLVFERLVKIEGFEASSVWLESKDMQDRLAEERDMIGARGLHLVEALV